MGSVPAADHHRDTDRDNLVCSKYFRHKPRVNDSIRNCLAQGHLLKRVNFISSQPSWLETYEFIIWYNEDELVLS